VIAHLAGTLISKSEGSVVIDCGGVGYAVAVSNTTYAQLPATGSQCSLHTELVVREDAMLVYGFATTDERQFFLQLITVQSVGPKVALSVLSAGSPAELCEAVALGDKAKFQSVAGVGKRTAERIVVELKDKVGSFAFDPAKATGEAASGTATTGSSRLLARDSLVALGYQLDDADELLRNVEAESVEDLVSGALKAARQ